MYAGFISENNQQNIGDLVQLQNKLSIYYPNIHKENYWEIADSGNAFYSPTTLPYHCELIQLIERNSGLIADLGCGSSHLLRNLEDQVKYTGIDTSAEQIEKNKVQYPHSNFKVASVYNTELPEATFDWVISLYTLEHCVYPKKLIDEMVRLTKPGGRLVIICPHFRPNPMPSMWYGHDPRPLRKKLFKGLIKECILDVWERNLSFPRQLLRAHLNEGGFLIYKDPRCFYTQFYSDIDAVYWTYYPEIREYIQRQNFKIEQDHLKMGNPMPGNMFFVAVKS